MTSESKSRPLRIEHAIMAIPSLAMLYATFRLHGDKTWVSPISEFEFLSVLGGMLLLSILIENLRVDASTTETRASKYIKIGLVFPLTSWFTQIPVGILLKGNADDVFWGTLGCAVAAIVFCVAALVIGFATRVLLGKFAQ